jgi:hypothetical protein
MIGCRDVVQDGQAKVTLGNVEPVSPTPSNPSKPQEKLISVVAMSDMADKTIARDSACSGHARLIRLFGTKNAQLAVSLWPVNCQYLDNSFAYDGPIPTRTADYFCTMNSGNRAEP